MQRIAYQRFCPIRFPILDFGFIICSSRLILEEGADKHVKCWPLFLETVEAAKAVTKANFVEVATQHEALLWQIFCGTVTDVGDIDVSVSMIC